MRVYVHACMFVGVCTRETSVCKGERGEKVATTKLFWLLNKSIPDFFWDHC